LVPPHTGGDHEGVTGQLQLVAGPRVGRPAVDDRPDPVLQLAVAAAEQGHPAGADRQRRAGCRRRLAGGGQPAFDRRRLTGVDRLHEVAHREPAGEVGVTRGQRLTDGGVGLTRVAVPVGGPSTQRGLLLRGARPELGQQQLAEERVVPVPEPVVVQAGHEEVVRRRQALEPLAAAGSLDQGVAERSAEALEHRGADQERPVVGVERGQHLLADVGLHGEVADRQVRQVPHGLGTVADGDHGELQGRRPALRHVDQGGGEPGGDPRECPVDHVGGLVVGEGQLLPAQDQGVAGGQPSGPADRRQRAGAHHDGRPRGHHVEHPTEEHQRRTRPQLVHVVEDQHAVGAGVQGTVQRRQDGPVEVRRGCRDRRRRLGHRRGGVDGGHQVAGQADRVVVGGIQRQPRRRALVARDPLARQGRLARTGRPVEDDQPGSGGVEAVQQAQTLQLRRAQAGGPDLGPQHAEQEARRRRVLQLGHARPSARPVPRWREGELRGRAYGRAHPLSAAGGWGPIPVDRRPTATAGSRFIPSG
jgi:hypothetical protein